jgi:hypothetical protein
MALFEDRRFGRVASAISPNVLRSILVAQRNTLGSAPWVHCGYERLPAIDGLRTPVLDVSARVDNMFRLGSTLGFETSPIIVTTGLRSSRFAAILFWEVLHVLAVDGVWIDIDEARFCTEPAHGFEDFLDFLHREYFRDCLAFVSVDECDGTLVQTFRKTRETALAPTIDDCGWTFGILTSGPSPQAARMAAAILDLDLPNVEIIFCGPRPVGAPNDPRVSAIDLERPEPRGWITRKKNLIADRARYDNLCVLHDRFVITPDWAEALDEYGQCYSFLTFPQVYYAGVDRQFPLRYPDYQLLAQQHGIEGSLETAVYDAHRVFCPDYDDFSETSFCSGGLYLARRSLWNLVRQDEALDHSEWEDISFGLECQRRGLPHRVNPFVVAESVTPHPLALTRIDTIRGANAERGRLQVSPEQEAAARAASAAFKPVVAQSRDEYYEGIRQRFNAIEGLTTEEKLPVDFAVGCRGLADVWAAVERHVTSLRLTTREEIAQLAFFMAATVYDWPAPKILSWIKRHEEALGPEAVLRRFSTIVGWGTGSAFQANHQLIGRDLAFVIDSDPSKWGGTIAGVTIRPQSVLSSLDGERTAVVVFSCFYEEIAARIRSERPDLAIVPYNSVVAGQRFQPLVDLVAYYTEVERYYPRLFSQTHMELRRSA